MEFWYMPRSINYEEGKVSLANGHSPSAYRFLWSGEGLSKMASQHEGPGCCGYSASQLDLRAPSVSRSFMGYVNSVAFVQRQMDLTLHELADLCKCYIGDIVIASATFDEHLHLDQVFSRL